METIYIYPGTFCPPHFGHVAVAKEAARIFGNITVICSVNPVKEGKMPFTPEECKAMWQTYGLGRNIVVATLDEFLAAQKISETTVMVRGIRDDNDIKFENNVILYNCDKFGIRHYHYVLAEKIYAEMSSTKARIAAQNNDLAELEKMVNPDIAAKMLERYHPEN
jgi:cytidyltransferase-like protein